MRRLDLLLREAFLVGSPFWRSDERWRAALLLGATVVLNLGLVGIAVLLTFWQRAFYNALESRDWNGFIALLLWWRQTARDGFVMGFAVLGALFMFVTTYAQYLRQALQIQWRRWLTENYIERWLADGAHYRLVLTDRGTDNPDQRIAEDVRFFVDNTLILGLGAIRAIVSLVSFVVILWSLSGSLVIFGMAVPGYLVWTAFAYAGLGTWLTHLLGRRLIDLNYAEQKVEADFRFGLMRVCENAEGIALHRGEADEHRELSRRFGVLVDNWRAIMTVTKRLTAFATGFSQTAMVFPLAVVAPAYFAGRLSLGGIFQTSNAFVQVQTALSWFVDNYGVISGWCATVDRLAGFMRSVATVPTPNRGPSMVVGDGELVLSADLTLPNGCRLLRGPELRIRHGERVLVGGPSGSGKSTLFRAIAGIWPFGSGEITVPKGRQLFLPQRPYIPVGTLKRVVCYPMPEESFSDGDVAAALRDAGIGYLTDLSGETDTWEQRLSGGEQQRATLARALLLRPDWLFLDEATASLDPDAEKQFYQRLREALPGSTIISIAHRETLAEFHGRAVHIEDGCFRVAEVSLVELQSPSGRADDGDAL